MRYPTVGPVIGGQVRYCSSRSSSSSPAAARDRHVMAVVEDDLARAVGNGLASPYRIEADDRVRDTWKNVSASSRRASAASVGCIDSCSVAVSRWVRPSWKVNATTSWPDDAETIAALGRGSARRHAAAPA